MEIQPISSIECVLLHNRFSPLASEKITAHIPNLAALLGCRGDCHMISELGQPPVFTVGDYRITIIQENKPLPIEGFGGCLPQPITKMMMPDAEQRVANHTAHSFVTIARNLALRDYDITPSLDEETFENFVSTQDSLRAMTLAYQIADVMHRNNQATAFHWLPSDYLVPPQAFEQAGSEASLTSFFIRPYLYSSDGYINDQGPVGMVANGSQYLLPKPVIFKEANVSYEWMIKRSIQFIDMAIKADAVPANGAPFGVAEGEIIEVFHQPPEPANPMGAFMLVPRNVPEFGIKGGLHSILKEDVLENDKEEHVQEELNKDDPIDLAILNALRERMQEAQNPTPLPRVQDRRMGPRETHRAATFGKRKTFGKR
ncbi:hypothetical protein WNY59_05845 [Ahrensia kielensis]|uniref:DUF4261 domain-containing protein n=1 Tax=Ahrensia kielensis TaxID=76980 RepID=A0ABU9T4P5_9HYPH